MFPQEHPVSSKKPTPRSLISLPVYLPWKGDAFKFPVVLPWKRVLRRRKLSVPDVAGFFRDPHAGSLALSPKWYFCCLFV